MASYFLFCMKQDHGMVFMFVVSLRLIHCFYAVKKNINKYIEKQILWWFDFFEQIWQKRNVWFQNIARINCEFLLKKRKYETKSYSFLKQSRWYEEMINLKWKMDAMNIWQEKLFFLYKMLKMGCLISY